MDSLRNRDIVVTTPEKLDFALRNNPDLLDTVGLVVLDEAHTIGAGEREIRYEVLVQRLLRRPDAASRRIVCLSAILPQGDQIQDFVAWIRQDQPGNAVTVNWRPTRQRYGEIGWIPPRAVLRFRVDDVGEDAPYVNSFVKVQPPLGQQRTSLPRNRQDLNVMSAWRLVEDGHTVLCVPLVAASNAVGRCRRNESGRKHDLAGEGVGGRRVQGGLESPRLEPKTIHPRSCETGEEKGCREGKLGRQPPCFPYAVGDKLSLLKTCSNSVKLVKDKICPLHVLRPCVNPCVARATREVLGEHGHLAARSP